MNGENRRGRSEKLREWIEGVGGFFGFFEFESACVSCGKSAAPTEESIWSIFLPERKICTACETQLVPIRGELCVCCGRYLDWKSGPSRQRDREKYDLFCPGCKEKGFFFDYVLSVYEYNGLTKELLHRLKYCNEPEIAEIFGAEMAEFMGRTSFHKHGNRGSEYILVPVPVSLQKLKLRGYNQALLLSEAVSRHSGIPVWDALKRIKDTECQHRLTKMQRNENIHGAFSASFDYNIYNRKIILVDDIFTTGSTASECARVLKEAGCRELIVLTAAGGGRK